MSRLTGKVILTTGGTQGIGEAVALHAARNGAEGIVFCGRQQDRGQAVATRIQELGSAAEFVRADLSNVKDCQDVVRRCEQRFGRVDGLVNVAADTSRAKLEDTTVDTWDYQFAVNVRAPFILTRDCVRLMKRENIAGSIVNIQSVCAYCGPDDLVAYSSTKGALSTFTKNIANGFRKSCIRVNGINLGWTDTPAEDVVQRDQGSPADWLEIAERKSPFGRLIKPDDVARLCLYLLSDDSGVLTGSNIDYSQRVMGFYPP